MTAQEFARRISAGSLDPHKHRAMTRIVFTVESNTKVNTPVRTGHLQASNRGAVASSERGSVRNSVHYAYFVHEGTRYMRGRPFMQRGLASSTSLIQRFLEEMLVNFVAEVNR
jgi:hypothetical protein